MAVHHEQSNIGDIKKNSLVLHALVAWAAHRWPRSDKKANAPGGVQTSAVKRRETYLTKSQQVTQILRVALKTQIL